MNKLSRDINRIIYNYLDVSNKHLLKIFPKFKTEFYYSFKKGITLLDILVKCLQLGHIGFFITDDMYRGKKWNINDKRIKYCNKDNYHYFYLNIAELEYINTSIDINRLDILNIEIEKELIE